MNLTIIIGNRNYSSWSLRAWLVLAKTGASFETLRIPLDTPDFYKQIKEISPSRTVPVLRHNDLTISDSLAINEYLAEIFPEANLWPESTGVRAQARSISCEMHSGFASLRQELPMNCRATGRSVKISRETENHIMRINSMLSHYLANRQDTGPWLFGNFSIADAMFLPVLFRFNTYGINSPDAVLSYQKHCFEDPHVKDWLDLARSETEVIDAGEQGLTDA